MFKGHILLIVFPYFTLNNIKIDFFCLVFFSSSLFCSLLLFFNSFTFFKSFICSKSSAFRFSVEVGTSFVFSLSGIRICNGKIDKKSNKIKIKQTQNNKIKQRITNQMKIKENELKNTVHQTHFYIHRRMKKFWNTTVVRSKKVKKSTGKRMKRASYKSEWNTRHTR